MSNKEDTNFLADLRENIDEYLFLGHTPSIGSPGHDPDVDKMDEALRDPKFQELRRRINEAKPRAMKIMSRFNVDAVYVQYPPSAIGGPVIRQHLLDAVTENLAWRRFSKARILDLIDQTIGALKLEQDSSESSDEELDDKLPILRSSYLTDRLQHIINETIGAGSPIAFVMVDIDNFKSFNEDFGHLLGDDVLKITSTLISRIVANKGKVVRFGGEEISIILPNYDLDEAKSLAERVRKTIEGYNFKVDKEKSAKITVSLGLSATNTSIDYKDFIKQADDALRVSKQHGRNKVSIYSKE